MCWCAVKKLLTHTIPRLCRYICSQLRHVSTIGKKLVQQQCLQYGKLRPTSGWDRSGSLGGGWCTPSNFNGFRVLAALLHGTPVVGVSQTAALNRGRHLYSARRPSSWASVHILVVFSFFIMAAHSNAWQAIIFCSCGYYLSSSILLSFSPSILSGRRLMSTILSHMMWP